MDPTQLLALTPARGLFRPPFPQELFPGKWYAHGPLQVLGPQKESGRKRPELQRTYTKQIREVKKAGGEMHQIKEIIKGMLLYNHFHLGVPS